MLLTFIWARSAETDVSADLCVIRSCSQRRLAALQFASHLPAYKRNVSTACAWTLDKALREQTLLLTGNPFALKHEI